MVLGHCFVFGCETTTGEAAGAASLSQAEPPSSANVRRDIREQRRLVLAPFSSRPRSSHAETKVLARKFPPVYTQS